MSYETFNFCFVYMDDEEATNSSSESEQLDHLECIFQRLLEAGLVLNVDGIQSDPDKVEAIKNFSLPTTMKDLRRFLGMLNFDVGQETTPKAARHQAILNAYLFVRKTKGFCEVAWSTEAIRAFEILLMLHYWHFLGLMQP